VEPASTREREYFAGDNSAQGFEPLLRLIEIIRVQNDQRATRSNRLSRSEATGKAAITEFRIALAVVDECPAERTAVESFAAGNQSSRTARTGSTQLYQSVLA